jgi:translation initiation factor IF-1
MSDNAASGLACGLKRDGHTDRQKEMPKRNLAGGKGFKKGRKVGVDEGASARFDGLEVGQDLARVLKMLGNRRVLCFCNDGMERVCKIRGVLCWGPKKQRIEIGDFVVTTGRDFTEPDSDEEESGGLRTLEGGLVDANGHKEIRDIIMRLSPGQIRDVRRRQPGIHPKLFDVEGAGAHRSDAFEFRADSDSDAEESGEGDDRVDKRNKIRHRAVAAAGGAGATTVEADEELDIDRI